MQLTEQRLKELGFTPTFLPTNEDNKRVLDVFEYRKGNIVYVKYKDEVCVQIYSPVTSDLYYARTALGVQNEEDLLLLCKLING